MVSLVLKSLLCFLWVTSLQNDELFASLVDFGVPESIQHVRVGQKLKWGPASCCDCRSTHKYQFHLAMLLAGTKPAPLPGSTKGRGSGAGGTGTVSLSCKRPDAGSTPSTFWAPLSSPDFVRLRFQAEFLPFS